MKYPVRITPDGDQWLAVFPDIPEAITGASTVEETLVMAQDVLESSMDFYFEDLRPVPPPSPIGEGEYAVTLPVSMAAKVLLLNEMLDQRVTPAELARRLHTTRQEISRMTDLHHTTKIDRLAEAAKALGKEVEISFA